MRFDFPGYFCKRDCGITRRVSSFSHQATTFRTASDYRHGVILHKHTEVLGDTDNIRASKRRGSVQSPFFNKLLRFGALGACFGLSAPALAQTYDAVPVPADITVDKKWKPSP